MAYRLGKTLEEWMRHAEEYAPLGPVAVEEAVRTIAGYNGVEVASLSVVASEHMVETYQVGISHRDAGEPSSQRTLQLTAFSVSNGLSARHFNWDKALAFMADRQARAPLPFAGLPTNVTQEVYDEQLRAMNAATGYAARWGEVWMHEDANSLRVGHVTRAGEILMRKYLDTLPTPPSRLYDIFDPANKGEK